MTFQHANFANKTTDKLPRWTREEIRHARLVALPALLEKHGFVLIEREAQNYHLPAFPGLIIKDSYWRWPEENLAGNAIDFFTKVLKRSFNEAMQELVPK